MRILAALAVLTLCGCARTTFYHNGHKVLETQANIRGLVVNKDGELRADIVDHSTPTEAGGDLLENGIGAAVGGITAWRAVGP